MIKRSVIGLLLLLSLNCSEKPKDEPLNIRLENITLNIQPTYIASTPIVIKSKKLIKNKSNLTLYLHHTYGSIVVTPEEDSPDLRFTIPAPFYNKTGDIHWRLLNDTIEINQGKFEIIPKIKSKVTLESYLGPQTVLAGGKHHVMMVNIPMDSLNNPLPDNTLVVLKDQYNSQVEITNLYTKNLITWKRIYSKKKIGKKLLSSHCNKTASKEFELDILPNGVSDFNINIHQNHNYADGNQITTITTDLMRDPYGNIVIDGTMVNFYMDTQNGIKLRTHAATINGQATAQFIHPDRPMTYNLYATVEGMALSNSTTLKFKQAIKEFPYYFSEDNRVLFVGPIKGFMNQIVPDGIRVRLRIKYNDNIEETLRGYTKKGNVFFELKKELYTRKRYSFELYCLGVTYHIKEINYETN